MEDKFEIIITDTGGRTSMEIRDYLKGTKCPIEAEFFDNNKVGFLSIGGMAQFIVKETKKIYREDKVKDGKS